MRFLDFVLPDKLNYSKVEFSDRLETILLQNIWNKMMISLDSKYAPKIGIIKWKSHPLDLL